MVRINQVAANTMTTRERPVVTPSNEDRTVSQVRAESLKVSSSAQEKQWEPEELQNALGDINRAVKAINERLEFRIHEATNTVMIKVVDQDTKQVIKEIPPEKFLDLVAKLQELAGMFVDQKV